MRAGNSASLPREPLQQLVPADPSISLQAHRGEWLFEGSAGYLILRLKNPILVVSKDNYSPLMQEYPGLAAAICIAQHHRSISEEKQLGADNSVELD